MILARLLTVTGRVQGVGFRAWLEREARRRDLHGWVRNRHNGSVEALVVGEESAIAALVAACPRGPAMARVDHVTQSPGSDDGTQGFHAKATV